MDRTWRLGKGIWGKGNGTREDAKLGIEGHWRMSQRFLFLLRQQPGLDSRRGASTEAGGGVSVKRQSRENTEMATPAQGRQQGRELSVC